MLLLLSTLALAGPGERTAPCLMPSRRAGRPQSIGSITSDLYPLRVHWDRVADEDRAVQALAALETAWGFQVEELGFAEPVLPDGQDGPELDLYFSSIGEWNAWVEPGEWSDHADGDGRMSTTGHIVIDRDLPDDWLDHYVSHEFNHVLQFATDFTEPSFPIWEGTAQAATRWTFPSDDRWTIEVEDFQSAPWAPVLLGDGDAVYDRSGEGWLYEYGTSFWIIALDREGSGDGSGGAALWDAAAQEGWSNEPDVLDAVEVVAERSLADFLSDVARLRWLVGASADERSLAEGPELPEVVPDHVWTLEELPVEVGFRQPLAVTGQGFVTLDLGGGGTPVKVEVRSDAGHELAVVVLTWGPEGEGELRADGMDVTVRVDGAVERAVVGITDLGPPGFDGDDDPWLDGQIVVGASLVTGPSCGCSSGGGGSGLWALVGLLALGRRRGSGGASTGAWPAKVQKWVWRC